MEHARHRRQLPSGFHLLVDRIVDLWRSGLRLEAIFVSLLPALLVLFALIVPQVAAVAFAVWTLGNMVGFKRKALQTLRRQYDRHTSGVLAWARLWLRVARAALIAQLLRISAVAMAVAEHAVLDQRAALRTALALIDCNLVFRLVPPAASRAF